jgi:hypothetical protein
MRHVPHSKELPVTKPPENPTFSDDNSDSYENHGQYEGDNVDCDPTFKASCSPSEPHLLTQGDLKDLARHSNFSLKKTELLRSKLKGWNLLHQDNKIYFFRNRQNEFKEFLSRKR